MKSYNQTTWVGWAKFDDGLVEYILYFRLDRDISVSILQFPASS